MTMVELTPDRIFALNPNIRWVGLANESGEVVFAQMRPGVKSLSPEEEDREFMQLGPMLLTGVSERLAPWAGGLQSINVRYRDATMVIKKFGSNYLAVTINSKDYAQIRETTESLERMAI